MPAALLGGSVPGEAFAGLGERLERSALGLTRSGQVVHAWSGGATAAMLGRALELAGCTYAVPLSAAPSASLAYLAGSVPDSASSSDRFYAVLRSVSPPPLPSGSFIPDEGQQPVPAWLPAIHAASMVSLGAQVHLTAFAPGRVVFHIRPGSKEPATRAVVALPSTLPEEEARAVAAIGLATGRKRGARGLIVDGKVGLPFRGDDAGALVAERGRIRVARAGEVQPAAALDATELPLTADDGKLRPEARDVGTMRPRAAACALDDGTFVVATTTFDSDESATNALLDLGCSRVVALDRGSHQAAFVHRAGTASGPEPHYEATALYAIEVPLTGRAGPL
jgi:hypothetical protein